MKVDSDGSVVVGWGGPAPVPCAEAPQLVWGPTDPTRIVNLTPTVTLFDDWRLTANIDAQWGHWVAADYATARYSRTAGLVGKVSRIRSRPPRISIRIMLIHA